MPNPIKVNDDLMDEKAKEGAYEAVKYGLKLIEQDQTAPIANFQMKMDSLSGFIDSCQRCFKGDSGDETKGYDQD